MFIDQSNNSTSAPDAHTRDMIQGTPPRIFHNIHKILQLVLILFILNILSLFSLFINFLITNFFTKFFLKKLGIITPFKRFSVGTIISYNGL